uniref:Pre-mRNA splicing Prp18-interacting factor n=1 Tax=Tanacetum cinerariifolium TaxID=118510 RepID=A0A699J681_TANCI|nr:hypothetical protein [Tanacetum cinerariifolium]
MTLFNGICDNCIYGAGMPIICTECGRIVRGGLCLPCDLREKDLYNYDPNAYSFNNFNYFPQPQDENYLCNLCENNSHEGYDCQQQFSFVYEQEPSYNHNYDDNYYPHESLSFPCCDYCGGSHETFECQPDNQNVDFSGSDQIQTPHYPDVNPLSPEINIHQLIDECCEEVPEEQKQNMEKTMLDLVKLCHHKQFLCIHDDVDDLIESALDSKLFLITFINFQHLDKKEQEVKIVEEQPAERGNRNEKSLQNFKVIHKSSISLNTSQISSIHAVAPILSTKEPENSLSMGYEHLSITPKMEVIESNAKNLLPMPSECEVTSEDKRECDELVCVNHSDTFSDSKIDDDISVYDDDFEDIEYVEESLPDPEIVSIEEENGVEEENVVQREEKEVDLEDISQVQDVVLREKLFSITRLISNIESLNDNSTPDRVLNSFESDNSLLDNFLPEFEIFCDHSEETRSGNTTHANYSLSEYDSFCLKIKPDQERLINLVENDNSNSSNDPLLEEVDLFLFDDSIPPGIENVADDPEGDIRFLEELLIDDSILSHELSVDNFKENPLISQPPPEPPDDNFDLEPEVISAVMEEIDEPDEHFNPGGEIFVSTNNEDVDYFPFMFVIRIFLPYLILPEISPLLLSAESEDTIFDHVSPIRSSDFSLGWNFHLHY